MWAKLNNNDTFTTFRFPRRDQDWYVGEVVQIAYKPRSKDKKVLGIARIIAKETRDPRDISNTEAIEDGFTGLVSMLAWLRATHGAERLLLSIPNKLTLKWIEQ